MNALGAEAPARGAPIREIVLAGGAVVVSAVLLWLVSGQPLIALAFAGGVAIVALLLRAGLSLMPEGLEKQIDVQGMADLMTYLMEVK